MEVDDNYELRVKFYTRSFMPNGAEDVQERVLDQLADLREHGILSEFECEVWGKRVCTSGRSKQFGQHAIDTVGQFRTWAEANDVSILPFFDERTSHSKITGETYSEIVFPMMCLAVYRDDDLVGVYPHADGDSVRTVPDFLASLAEDTETRDEPRQPGATLA